MLKKAGIVVLGATAGMLSLAPLASAGEAPQRNDHQGHHQGHDHDGHHGHDHDRDRGPRGGDCDSGADATLLNISDIGCDLDVGPINAGGDQVNVDQDDDDRDGRGGGRDGDHRGHRHDDDALINVSDILQNPTVNPVNALGNQANID